MHIRKVKLPNPSFVTSIGLCDAIKLPGYLGESGKRHLVSAENF